MRGIVRYEVVIDAIRDYWNRSNLTAPPVGTKALFDHLDEYRFDKLHYLPRLGPVTVWLGEAMEHAQRSSTRMRRC